MAHVYARLIELGILIIIGGIIILITRIKDYISFKKWEKDWLENSFEFEGRIFQNIFFDISFF